MPKTRYMRDLLAGAARHTADRPPLQVTPTVETDAALAATKIGEEGIRLIREQGERARQLSELAAELEVNVHWLKNEGLRPGQARIAVSICGATTARTASLPVNQYFLDAVRTAVDSNLPLWIEAGR